MLIFMLIDFHILPPTAAEPEAAGVDAAYSAGEDSAAKTADFPRYHSWWRYFCGESCYSVRNFFRALNVRDAGPRVAGWLFGIDV